MELLSIGAFAHASGLTPKALRLYDELDLLRPVEVDPQTGYRRYGRAQLRRARLVLWMRRLGMSLAQIRTVAELSAPDQADAVVAFADHAGAAAASQLALATSLVAHLRQEADMFPEPTRLDRAGTDPGPALRVAAATDPGSVRDTDQDAAHAGPGVGAVADGFGPAGAAASRAAVGALVRHLDGPGDVLARLQDAAMAAQRSVLDELAAAGAAGERSGTTLTAMAADGTNLAVVHIGDGRAYRWRDGVLTRLTADHTHIQVLLETGRITADEVAAHPDRLALTRAMATDAPSRPDSAGLRGQVGDRYLLVTDGVHRVLAEPELGAVLAETAGPGQAVTELVRRVRAAGAPDNLACVVAELVAGRDRPAPG